MRNLQVLALQSWRDISNEGTLVVDSSGTICLANARLREMLKLSMMPDTVEQLLSVTSSAMPELHSVLAPEHSSNFVQWGTLHIRAYPSRWLSWQQVPLREDNDVKGVLTIFRDTVVQEGQINLANQSFLSMISHDLRTPLSTILGFAELLYHNRGSLSDDEQKEFLEHIIKNANELSRYTQIALDIMYLEANLQSFETEIVYLDRFVKHWLSDALHRFSADRLVYHNGSSNDPLTQISPAALHRILYILVEFALAESPPEGQVDIRLHYDHSQAHIVFHHQAPGLTAAEAAVLFRLMHPRDLSETGRPQLHRMQLYVASLLAERQQGYLTLRGRDDSHYQIDLALPLASEMSS